MQISEMLDFVRGLGGTLFTSRANAEAAISRLGRFDDEWLRSAWLADGWESDGCTRDTIGFPEMTGGLNAGDQRALYQVVRKLKPSRVLEIGTHLGCSTTSLSLAAARNQAEGRSCAIDTVDIRDVNCTTLRPWVQHGSPMSPRSALDALRLGDLVRFWVSDSKEWMQACTHAYDLIFLDGNHDAQFVKREIPLAANLLSQGGMILLHDYFPGGKPLWKGKPAIHGPYVAIANLRRRGWPIRAIPLGSLPWPTKLGSSATSLAVLSRA